MLFRSGSRSRQLAIRVMLQSFPKRLDIVSSQAFDISVGYHAIEIAGTNKKCIDDAMRIIKGIVAVPEVGEVYVGKVGSVMP